MLLHFHNLSCAYNHLYNLQQKSAPLFTPHPRYFCMQPSQQSTPKIFSLHQPFNQFKLHQGTKELWSLVRNDTVLITPFFLKVWTVRTGLHVIIKSCTHFRVNLHSIVAWMSRKSLLKRSQYLNFKWQQRDSNAQLLRLYTWI